MTVCLAIVLLQFVSFLWLLSGFMLVMFGFSSQRRGAARRVGPSLRGWLSLSGLPPGGRWRWRCCCCCCCLGLEQRARFAQEGPDPAGFKQKRIYLKQWTSSPNHLPWVWTSPGVFLTRLCWLFLFLILSIRAACRGYFPDLKTHPQLPGRQGGSEA